MEMADAGERYREVLHAFETLKANNANLIFGQDEASGWTNETVEAAKALKSEFEKLQGMHDRIGRIEGNSAFNLEASKLGSDIADASYELTVAINRAPGGTLYFG
jgi:hypothetical protein